MWQVWEYPLPTGDTARGIAAGFSDFGGTDVSHRFHRLGPDGRRIEYENGGHRLDIVNGPPAKLMKRIGAMQPGGAFVVGGAA